ncbi:putative carboxylesterase 18 [Camellia lanceoleosa]|nr:putative carboxylesterase 18 [Camellia lanceoleosa]
MEKHLWSESEDELVEVNFPSCMLGIIHALDWHNSIKKMLPHKKHNGPKHTKGTINLESLMSASNGKTAMVATVGIDSDFPCVKIWSHKNHFTSLCGGRRIEEWALNTIHVVPPLPPLYLSTSVLSWRTRLFVHFGSFILDACCLSHLILRFLRNVDLKSPPSSKPINGVSSSDMNIDPSRNLWFRLYLPPSTTPTTTLPPLLIYFHGGGFLTSAANSKIYDHLCRNLAA